MRGFSSCRCGLVPAGWGHRHGHRRPRPLGTGRRRTLRSAAMTGRGVLRCLGGHRPHRQGGGRKLGPITALHLPLHGFRQINAARRHCCLFTGRGDAWPQPAGETTSLPHRRSLLHLVVDTDCRIGPHRPRLSRCGAAKPGQAQPPQPRPQPVTARAAPASWPDQGPDQGPDPATHPEIEGGPA